MNLIDALVDAQAKEAGLPKPVRELRFAAPRRWRFDHSWREQSIALEIDGGVWTQGRHTRGAGFLADCEKLNTAACMGWKVLRLTPQQVRAGELTNWLRLASGQ